MTERTRLPEATGLLKDKKIPPPPARQSATPAPASREVPLRPAVKGTSAQVPPAAEAGASAKPRLQRTTISLPVDLREQLREAATKTTHAEVILGALEASAGDLPRLVAEDRNAPSAHVGLFPDRGGVRHRGEQRTVAPLVTTAANLTVIDSLVEASGADSRSQLITVALRVYLSRGS